MSTFPRRDTLPLPHYEHRARVLRHSSSNSQLEATSRGNRDMALDSVKLRRRLVEQTNHVGTPPIRPWRVHRVRTAPAPFEWMNPNNPTSPGFMFFPRRSTMSEPVTPKKPKARNSEGLLPLKTCLKHPLDSTGSTPVKPSSETGSESADIQPLRRVKTVEFLGHTRDKPSNLPPLKAWTGEGSDSSPLQIKARRRSSYPGPKMKSEAADTVTTRTDVRVVAIAPSWSNRTSMAADDSGIHPSTPTMQIVESKSGVYEIVWDDMGPEEVSFHSDSGTPSSTRANQGSPFTPGALQRVNSKLSEWSWNADSPNEGSSTPFRPQIVVLPSDKVLPSPARHFAVAPDDAVGEDGDEDEVEDEVEDVLIIAPPNSKMTSEAPSDGPSPRRSRPASTPESRTASTMNEESDSGSSESDTDPQDPEPSDSTVLPSVPSTTDTRPPKVTAYRRRVRRPPTLRRLSNMEEERKFRWHRDSVALARERMFHEGPIAPELYMKRDSIAIARKRMHQRNHAISAARETGKKADELRSVFSKAADSKGSGSKTSRTGDVLADSQTETAALLPRAAAHSRHIRISSEVGDGSER
ncbi:hypothetical protein GQ43DRAFT_267409 [Delitschia confertaspora ATCC 74209]|uniref:Uncharacterized protein n=1 Tax=Delitschia confertaspora ATCC 74209 TaxID=1513339 RepID=A0A9P4JQN3_9PLEO|nr:hypothetical protein GQ43DRAFT_267409 [Delitschia confertaspora ATCC 74209]